MPDTSTRMLVIGLGGVGSEVAYQLRRRLMWRYGDNLDELPVRFRSYDTHVEAWQKLGIDGMSLDVSPHELDRMRRDSRHWDPQINLSQWVDESLLNKTTTQSFVAGVGGVRMYGRLAFLATDHWNMICDQLVGDVGALQGARMPGIAGPIRIYVIASAGGGTGSGSFIDAGYLLQHLADEKRWNPEELEQVGIAVLPRPDVGNPRYRRNAAGLLTELDECCDPTHYFKVRHRRGTHIATPDFETPNRPYEYCIAVSPAGQEGDTEDAKLGALCHRLAEVLYADVHGQLAEAWGKMEDASRRFSLTDEYGYYYGLSTLGSSRIEFPAEVCRRACVAKVAGELTGRLTTGGGEADVPPPAVLAESYRDLGLVHQLQSPTTTDDRVFQLLIKAPEGQPSLLDSLKSIVQEQGAAFEAMGRQIDDAFSGTGPGDASHKQFSAYRIIRSNRNVLFGGSGPAADFVARCMDIALDPTEGVARAQALVTKVQEAARAEIAVIDAEAGEAKAWASFVRPELRMLRGIKNDVLNPLKNWAAGRMARGCYGKVFDYCSARLEMAVLPIKRELCQNVASVVCPVLLDRLRNLDSYLREASRMNTGPDGIYNEALRLTGGSSILMDADLVADKVGAVLGNAQEESAARLSALRSLSASGTGNFDELRRELLQTRWTDPRGKFDGGYPRDETGSTDFGLFEQFEGSVGDRLQEGEQDGQVLIENVEVPQLLADRTAADDGGYEASITDAIRRSAEWLGVREDAIYRDTGTQDDPAVNWWAFHRYTDPDDPLGRKYRDFREALSSSASKVASTLGLGVTLNQRPIEDPRLILILRTNVGFPSRLIHGFAPAERVELLNSGAGFSRRGVELPPEERQTSEAAALVVGCLACGLLRFAPDRGGVLRYRPATGEKRDEDLSSIEVSNEYSQAVRLLARRDQWRFALGDALRTRVKEEGEAGFNEAIRSRAEALRPSEAGPGVAAAWGIRKLTDLEAYNQLRAFALRFGHLGLRPHQPREHSPDAELREAGDTLSATKVEALEVAWYCLGCGSLAWYPGQAMPDKCGSCGQPIRRSTR